MSPRIARTGLCLLVAWLAAPGASTGGEAENWERLRAMPREQRAVLAENLKRFEALDRSERDAIRALDQQIASKPADDQARYRTVLRAYHLWVASLPEDKRNELLAAAPDQRLALATKIRKSELEDRMRPQVPLFLQIADFSSLSPYYMAHVVKIWLELTPAERLEVEKLAPGPDRQNRLAELGKQLKIRPEDRLSKTEDEALIASMETALQAKGEPALPKRKDVSQDTKFRRRLAENFYFIAHPPGKVDGANLARFENALPGWIRSAFDPLPPEEARRRLRVLYRLVFPEGKEMPLPKPAAPAGPAKGKTPAFPKPKAKSDAPF